MVIRVQEMINKKREERQKEEQEKELKKEKERIQLGREMAKLKNSKVCERKSFVFKLGQRVFYSKGSTEF